MPSEVTANSLNRAPALLISTSIGRSSARNRSHNSLTSDSELRSASSTKSAGRPAVRVKCACIASVFSGFRITTVNLAPASSNDTAAAAPSPELAPVNTTCLPVMSVLIGAQRDRPLRYPKRVKQLSAPGRCSSRFAVSRDAVGVGLSSASARANP